MKAKRGEIERALDKPGNFRLFLLHGPDSAGSAVLVARLASTLGSDVERVPIAPATLKADPARLADEAAAFSLFGDKRLILVDGGGDELLDAVSGLLAAPSVGNPVVVVTGALKKSSKLLALVEGSPSALANASYVPEGRDADRMVSDLGRAVGLDVSPDLARRIGDGGNGDRSLIASELDKYALFLDAAPERPVLLSTEVVDALSAGAEDGDLSRIVDAVLDGDQRGLDRELAILSGTESIVLLRALARRLLMLVKYQAEMDGGASIDAVGRSMFFKDKPAITRQLGRWSGDRLATALSRVLEAEREVKSSGSLGADAVGEKLFAIAQAAGRRR